MLQRYNIKKNITNKENKKMVLMGVLENRKDCFSVFMGLLFDRSKKKQSKCICEKQPLCYEKYVFGLLKHFFDISLF